MKRLRYGEGSAKPARAELVAFCLTGVALKLFCLKRKSSIALDKVDADGEDIPLPLYLTAYPTASLAAIAPFVAIKRFRHRRCNRSARGNNKAIE